MGTQSITMYRGDTNTITVTVTDSEGSAFDLTDYTARLTVKKNANDTDSEAIIGPLTATIDSPTTGVCVFSISKDDSSVKAKTYIYDVQITSATKNYTIIKDNFIIVDDVTRINS